MNQSGRGGVMGWFVGLAGLAVWALATVGCSSNQGAVRFIHASPDAPAVDVAIINSSNQAVFVRNVAYTNTTAYQSLDTGTYVVEIRAAGAADTSSPVLRSQPFVVATNERASTVIAGLLSGTTDANRLRFLTVLEPTGVPGANAARAVFVNASPNAPAVSFNISQTMASAANVAPFTQSAPEGVDLPAGMAFQMTVTQTSGQSLGTFASPALSSADRVLVMLIGEIGLAVTDPASLSVLEVGAGGNIALLKPAAAAAMNNQAAFNSLAFR